MPSNCHSSLASELYLCIFILYFIFCAHGGVLVTHADESIVEIDAWYSTLGTPSISPNRSYPIIFLTLHNLTCHTLALSSPSSLLSSSSATPPFPPEHVLIILGDLLEGVLFQKCTNHFFDAYANGVLVASVAQSVGGAGVLIQGKVDEKQYSNYVVAGFNDKITIPFLVMPKESTQYFIDHSDTIMSISLPTITPKDWSFILHLRRACKAWALFNAISWTLFFILTAYLSYVDLVAYTQKPTNKRTLHPFLTKATPCFGSMLGSIWFVTDPFSFELKVHFPAYFFSILHTGCLLVASCLLLKTWILTVGDRLKSPRVFRISIIFITGLTIAQSLVIIIWVFGGKDFYLLGIIFAAITVFVCGTGFIYYEP
eukprot:Phypoly_transcript_05862.p1 GENE.Phypoly_transcript_05862~~Phypoly_transcript_05862.p1  ORF type:complete len:371 (+),score=35.38 Phypoly_transcript_05862:268-1380(+)